MEDLTRVSLGYVYSATTLVGVIATGSVSSHLSVVVFTGLW